MNGTLDKGWNPKAPSLQGRGLGWGLSHERLAELHGFGRENRNNPTQPEIVLWSRLNRSQLAGHKFRRQAVIGPYIADFMCPRKALVVEVDGHTHTDPVADARREARLRELGFQVLRVTNTDVMGNLEGVLELILLTLTALPDRWNRPQPDPSPEGEGL